MPVHASVLTDVVTVGIYILTLWLPGGIAAATLGVRGWQLAASAPLVTYFIAGMAGPLLHAMGLRYNVLSFACCALVVVLLCGVARWLTVRRRDYADRPTPVRAGWLRSSHLVVAGVALFSAVAGCYIVIRGLGWLDAIPQDWDAAFHANGIRYIADTGDGGLFGMLNVNLFEPPNAAFYPNGYHLVGALVYMETHASIAAILNADTVLWPGILALSLVALVRSFNGRVTTACYTALIAVAATAGVYENMYRGPLYPYMAALILIPVALIALHRYLQRPDFDTGTMFVIAAVGLLVVHSSTLFGGSLLALPLLVQRWWGKRSLVWPDVRRLLVVGVATLILAAPGLLAVTKGTAGSPPVIWPVQFTTAAAVGSLLVFQHIEQYPQIFLAIGLWVGLISYRRLGQLRWVLGSAGLAGLLFVAVAAYGNGIVIRISRPWWDDRFRLIAMAMLPLALIAGHGMAVIQDWCRHLTRRVVGTRLSPQRLTAAVAVVLLAVFLVGTKGLYHAVDSNIVNQCCGTEPGANTHDMQVSPDEVRAMEQLPALGVKPGDRVMNDRYDGSVWMYAIAGVHAVAGHYNNEGAPPETFLLADSFNKYDTDPAVRAAVAKLHITYVMVDSGFIRGGLSHQPGVTDLDKADFLTKVYSNPDATIYRLVAPGTGR
ncbi:MAG TPA: DUF6541 family protein [Pseudonocardiaceae bacterium]